MWPKPIQFELLEKLGEGSQGCVHKAIRRDSASGLEQTIAIKVLHSKIAVELWRQEFESLRRVRSPYCVQVLSFERLKRRPAIILEYVDGTSLAHLGQISLLDQDDITEVLAQIECGLIDLHGAGIFHGDLSPTNVLITRDGQIRLLDFGLANCNSESTRMTPRFAAPERVLGAPASAAADLFSLGCLEEHLRVFSVHCGPNEFLFEDPTARRFRGIAPCAERQRRMAIKVNSYLEMQKQRELLQTKTQLATAPKTWQRPQLKALLGAMTIFCILLTSSTSQSLRLSSHSWLSIRTQRWHSFIMDGRPVGYAPLNLAVSANEPHLLEWVSARGRGQMTIFLSPKTSRRLVDSDLSH